MLRCLGCQHLFNGNKRATLRQEREILQARWSTELPKRSLNHPISYQALYKPVPQSPPKQSSAGTRHHTPHGYNAVLLFLLLPFLIMTIVYCYYY